MTEKLLICIMEISQQMIEVGAEIYRIEESVTRICKAYGAVRVDVFATTSNVIVSAEKPDGTVLTQTRRITGSGTDIEKLHRLNDLVRTVTATTPDCATIREKLAEIEKTKKYPAILYILFNAVIAASFCIFFGGRDYKEIIASFVIGFLIGIVSLVLERRSLNKILSRFACSFVSAMSAFVLLRLGVIESVDNVIIGNIMSLIPGIGLTNSLRDLFTGDIITGALRSIEAILLALAIAFGYILSAFIFGGVA
ncbi:MAG: threonine/serine exporter family protein [Oscillospiraceae bacterium]|nr:threonine/serine exporter family protein [Oscillospiraceae bacterium]